MPAFPALLLQAAAAVSPLAVRPDTTPLPHDVVHYDVSLVLSDSGTHVLGQTDVSWRLASADPVALQLDSALRVIRVLVNGRENTRLARTIFWRRGDLVVVPHESRAGDTLSTRVRYRGEVQNGLVFGSDAGGLRVFADNWPERAHGWLPVQDHPSDKATVAFHVQVPADVQVVANGVLEKIDTLPYQHRLWHYRLTDPIPTYSMVIGAGRFAVARLGDAGCAARCVPLSVWTSPADSATAAEGPFRRAGAMLDYFTQLIGPFPYGSLAHVQAATRFGGMENATAIFYSDSLIRAGKLDESTVAHETAHQWFGDAVTPADWHHLWLSEGFATYLAAMWAEESGGPSARGDVMRRAADRLFGSADIERPVIDPGVVRPDSLLNDNAYQKGAWVLHQLRGLIGDSAFSSALREYYRTYRHGNAVSADFAAVAGRAAGRDLDWYFRQALTQPGYPVLDVRWRRRGNALDVEISQTQAAGWGTYRLPGLVLRIDGKDYPVDVSRRTTRRTLRGIARAPSKVEVDPGGWWLLKATATGR
ncbi:MAG TPA: M1 family metallopeptidase [Gemmatimonadales bacterium]|nr:M1 family metallopeptidase [Gemmatimonadales bacterium]